MHMFGAYVNAPEGNVFFFRLKSHQWDCHLNGKSLLFWEIPTPINQSGFADPDLRLYMALDFTFAARRSASTSYIVWIVEVVGKQKIVFNLLNYSTMYLCCLCNWIARCLWALNMGRLMPSTTALFGAVWKTWMLGWLNHSKIMPAAKTYGKLPGFAFHAFPLANPGMFSSPICSLLEELNWQNHPKDGWMWMWVTL